MEDNYIKDLECLGRELVHFNCGLVIRRDIPLSLTIPTMHLGIRSIMAFLSVRGLMTGQMRS